VLFWVEFTAYQYDAIRNCLLNHSRGYSGMFGAILIEPIYPDADIGAFFMTNTGYLDMCVHSAIGVVARTPWNRN